MKYTVDKKLFIKQNIRLLMCMLIGYIFFLTLYFLDYTSHNPIMLLLYMFPQLAAIYGCIRKEDSMIFPSVSITDQSISTGKFETIEFSNIDMEKSVITEAKIILRHKENSWKNQVSIDPTIYKEKLKEIILSKKESLTNGST